MSTLERWLDIDGMYQATSNTKTVDEVVPGVYDMVATQQGFFFTPLDARVDELIRFPDTTVSEVVDEIDAFWSREAMFRAHELPYKRGILLWGPPGSGKSCTLQLIARDVVARGGVVLIFNHPDVFITGYRIFRAVQKDTPLVVLMEDLDTILERSPETKVLNLLDGIELVDKVVFLATTNYPEKMSDRIVNRPSRFDRKYKVAHPEDASRHMYLKSLIRGDDSIDLEKWASETKGLSLAHLKELFISVVILGSDYEKTLAVLKKMQERTSSLDNLAEFEESSYGTGQYV